MKTHTNYCCVCVNKTTGVIEHLAVSDLPIDKASVGSPAGIDGYKFVYFVLPCSDDKSVIPARELLTDIEMSGKASNSVVRGKQGSNRKITKGKKPLTSDKDAT